MGQPKFSLGDFVTYKKDNSLVRIVGVLVHKWDNAIVYFVSKTSSLDDSFSAVAEQLIPHTPVKFVSKGRAIYIG